MNGQEQQSFVGFDSFPPPALTHDELAKLSSLGGQFNVAEKPEAAWTFLSMPWLDCFPDNASSSTSQAMRLQL